MVLTLLTQVGIRRWFSLADRLPLEHLNVNSHFSKCWLKTPYRHHEHSRVQRYNTTISRVGKRETSSIGQIIGKFRAQIGETMRLDTLMRPRDAVHENHTGRKKRRVRRRRELIADAGCLQDGGLIVLQYSAVYPETSGAFHAGGDDLTRSCRAALQGRPCKGGPARACEKGDFLRRGCATPQKITAGSEVR